MTLSLYNPVLILLAPLLSAVINGLFGKRLGKGVFRLGLALHVIAIAVAIQILYKVVTGGPSVIDLSPLITPGSGIFGFTLLIDRLAAVMMVLISVITATIYIFSMNYMRQETDYPKFNVLLGFATFVLFCMVSSSNLITIFVFWQLVSFVLYLLSYQYSDKKTMQGAFKTFMTLRFGDVMFLLGIALAYSVYGTLELKEIFEQVPSIKTTYPLLGGIDIHANTAITLLIFVGAMSKSAQFPLHVWVRDALYAPTPMHALLHAGIINAGGFLINRLAPLYASSHIALHVILAIGFITVLIGSATMLTQNNIKRTLGYSTIGQMGFMILECGLGAFALAIFHLIAHGLFKATIFLNCGNIIHKARQDPKLPAGIFSEDGGGNNEENEKFSPLMWATGFASSLLLPLLILLAAHGALNIPLMDFQGAVVFMFFSWITSSRVITAIYRARRDVTFVRSLWLSFLMIFALGAVVFAYLFAAESFTYFLYPDHDTVAAYFNAAALPPALFDAIIGITMLFVIGQWVLDYKSTHGRKTSSRHRAQELKTWLYVTLINNAYIDDVYARLYSLVTRAAHAVEKKYLRFLP
ncbi:MAG: proton-conducting transporter membrane subunit [Deltaproteobacteria bacterium]|nr:proton-conducting transporter membrane subunit [Deltaproteobacteria bacterium]